MSIFKSTQEFANELARKSSPTAAGEQGRLWFVQGAASLDDVERARRQGLHLLRPRAHGERLVTIDAWDGGDACIFEFRAP